MKRDPSGKFVAVEFFSAFSSGAKVEAVLNRGEGGFVATERRRGKERRGRVEKPRVV